MYDAIMVAKDVSDDQKARICLRIAEADKVNGGVGGISRFLKIVENVSTFWDTHGGKFDPYPTRHPKLVPHHRYVVMYYLI